MRKFQDVFLNELLGLPPHREFDFSIEVYPGIDPISVSPYRMTLLELKELKTRFEELLKTLLKYIAMGSPSAVCEKEGWHAKVVY